MIEMLTRLFYNFSLQGIDSDLTIEEIKEINRELFSNEISPFSVFRGSVGYFCSKQNQLSQEFRFMGGTAIAVLDDRVTHIFVEKHCTRSSETRNSLANWESRSTKILDDRWIADCFREKKLLSVDNYAI